MSEGGSAYAACRYGPLSQCRFAPTLAPEPARRALVAVALVELVRAVRERLFADR